MGMGQEWNMVLDWRLGRGARRGANAVVSTGQIDVRAVVAASPTAGVEMHFIEDESADPMGRIPQSVAYFGTL